MSILLSQQTLPCRERLGSLRWLWKDLETHYQNQITLRERMDRLPVPAFATKFNPEGLHGNLLAAADEGGSVTLYDTRKLLSDSLVSEIDCHNNTVFDIAWAGSNKLLTASGDSRICLWDVTSGVALGSFRFHTASVKCVYSKKDEPSLSAKGRRPGIRMHQIFEEFLETVFFSIILRIFKGRGCQTKVNVTIWRLNEVSSSNAFPAVLAVSLDKLRSSDVCVMEEWQALCSEDILNELGKLNIHASDSMFVSSCRDGLICLWDTRCSSGAVGHKPANSIALGHSSSPGGCPPKKKRRDSLSRDVNACVTAVLFHGDNKIASAGGGDGLVKLWDMRKYHSVKGKLPNPWLSFDPVLTKGRTFGLTSLAADSHESFLFATCTDNIIYQYCSAGLITRPVGMFSGCKVSSFYVKSCLSTDNKYLLSGSSCGNGFIWEVDNPEAPPLLLPSKSPEVTAVAWCPSLDKLVTCTDECDMELWTVQRGHSQHAWGARRCTEYAGTEHSRAQEALKQDCLKENLAPPPSSTATTLTPKGVNHGATKSARKSATNSKSSQSQLRKYFSSSTS